MEYNKNLFWKVALAIFIILFASTFFFLVAQLQRHHIFVIQPQSVQTNIGVILLCIGSAFVLYYILEREEFFWFFARRRSAQMAFIPGPERLMEYRMSRYTSITGLSPDQIPESKELVRKGNLYLKLWVLTGAIMIVTVFLSWLYSNNSWVFAGGLIAYFALWLIEEFYLQNALGLWVGDGHNSWKYDLFFSRNNRFPFLTNILMLVFALLIISGSMYFGLLPPVYHLVNPDPFIFSLYIYAASLLGFTTLGIIYYIFRLKESPKAEI